jgi:uncharacterized protein (UPF0548 family)
MRRLSASWTTSAPFRSPTLSWAPRATGHRPDTLSTTTMDAWGRDSRRSRAVEALREWKMYETGWTKLCWPEVPIKEGAIVGILGRHFGLWLLNACRIAYVIQEEGPLLKRYGFAFGTLTGHVGRGEERFTVGWDRAEDSVSYEVFASPARPTRWSGRVNRSCGWSRGGSRPTPCGAWPKPSRVEGTDIACGGFIPPKPHPLERLKQLGRSASSVTRNCV